MPHSSPHPFQLPPEDRALSPRTGWTRAHWEAVADGLLAAVRPYATPGQGLIHLPGPRPSWSGERSDGLEGYARTFLLAAFRVAGAGGEDPDGLLERYADGLAAGTTHPVLDRDLAGHPESWLAVSDVSQAIVEAASIAIGLQVTRPWLWDRLDGAVQDRAAAWLGSVLRHTPADNNWWLFPLTVGGFLAGAGYETAASQAAIDRGLQKIEQWYLGDGWYNDGRPRAFDYYNGWALHLYPVLHAHLAGDQRMLDRYGPRLAEQLEGLTRLFGGDGAPVHQGRSLTYRFAAAAGPWLGALTGHTPLSPGATRRLASGCLRYFLDRGAARGGLLSLGWFGPFDPIVQPYSGPASPYWASKGFLGLLMPADHPVWTAVEEPLPAERADAVTALPAPGWLIQSTAADGVVRLHNHGSDNLHAGATEPDEPLYARLAYSTVTGPTVPGDLPDNDFCLVVDGLATERGHLLPLGAGDGWAASAHRPLLGGSELADVLITSVTFARGAEEIRAHLVTGATPGTGWRETGWAVTGEEASALPDDGAAMAGAATPGTVGVRALHRVEELPPVPLRSELAPLHGFVRGGSAQPPGGTAFGSVCRMPLLKGEVSAGPGGGLAVCAARLTAETTPGPAFQGLRVEVLPEGGALRIVWPDGTAQHAVLTPGAVEVSRPAVPSRPGGH